MALPISQAWAQCTPATGNNETVTCTGTTNNQGPEANTGYGDGTQIGLTLGVQSGASVTGSFPGAVGPPFTQANGISVASGNAITLQGGAQVSGVSANGANGILATDDNTIAIGSGASVTGTSNGISLGSNNLVTVDSAATITTAGISGVGDVDGITASGALTVLNSGTIGRVDIPDNISDSAGINTFGSGLVVNNYQGGLIQGQVAVQGVVSATITNSGTISGVVGGGGQGINVAGGAVTVTNNASGLITADSFAINADTAMVANYGTISAPEAGNGGNAITTTTSIDVTNYASGLITSDGNAITAPAITVTNFGTISGTGLGSSGISGGTVSLINSGSILGGSGAAAISMSGGSITNNAGGIIAADEGISASDVTTVFNAGTITGNTGTAIAFSATGNTLTIAPTSVINGTVIGSGSDTFQLGGTGTGAFNLSTIGTQYTGFNTFNVVGATWVATGTNGGNWSISSGATLQLGDGVAAHGGAITGNVVDNGAFAIDHADSYVFAGTISGAGSLAQIGSGTLTLSGSNNYTGTTTLTAGTLVLGTASQFTNINNPAATQTSSAIGNGTLVFNGGTLAGQFFQDRFLGNAVQITSNGGTVNDAGGSIRFYGNITDAPSSSGATWTLMSSAPSGLDEAIMLGGNSTYAAATNIASGHVIAQSTTGLSPNSAFLVNTGATLELSGFSNTIASLADGANGGGIVENGAASGNIALTIKGAAGVTTAFSGVIEDGGSGNEGGPRALALVKDGASTQILSGANLYSGGTTILGGELSVSSDANLGATTGGLTLSGGVLQITGTTYNGTSRTITLGSNGGGFDIADPANTFTVSQTLSGSGGLSKLGDGTLALTGTNGYFGGTTLTQGTLGIGNDSALGFGALTMAAGTTLTFDSTSHTIANNIIITGDPIFNTPTNTIQTISGTISDSTPPAPLGIVEKTGGGTLVLQAANTYSGGTIISAGTLQVTNNNSVGTGTVTLDGGTFQSPFGLLTFSNSFAINTTGGTIDIPVGAITLSGTIADGNGPGALTKTGAQGSLILTGANTYSGGTTVAAGVLQLGTATMAGSIVGPVTIDANAQFNVTNTTLSGVSTILANGFIQVLNASSLGSAAIANNFSIELLNSASAGNATITNTGSNTLLRFFNTSTAANASIINGGAIQFADSSTAASANIINNQELDFFNSSTAGSAAITNSGFVDFQNSSSAGSATVTNNGSWSFFDSTTAANATIANGQNASLSFVDMSTAANAVISNNGFISFGTSGGTDIPTAGNAAITNNSGGEIDFNAFSTAGNATITTNSGGYTVFLDNSTGGQAQLITNAGGVVDFSATLGPNNDGNVTAASISGAGSYYLGSSVLTVGGTNLSMTVSGVISDCGPTGQDCFGSTTGGALIKAGTGTLTLTGANTYTGGTTLSDGTIVVGNNAALGTGTLAMAAGTTLSFLNTGNFTLANNITIAGDPDFTPPAGTTQTLAGAIADGATPGTLNMNGAGTLVLSALNTYTGPTTVTSGTLDVTGSIASSSLTTVSSGAALTGTGTIGNLQISSGGMFAPGNGTPGTSSTVAGNLALQSGAIYQVFFNPTTSTSANVSGSASLAGTVNASWANGSYISKQYTILTAGSVSGTFSALSNTNLPTNFNTSLSYDTAHAYLNLTLNFTPPTGPSFSPLNVNESNVANTLVSYFNTTGSIPTKFGTLSSFGLTQADGEDATGAAHSAFLLMDDFLSLMLDPFVYGRGGPASGGGPLGFAPDQDTRLPSDVALAYAGLLKAPPKQTFEQRWTVWGAGFGGSGSANGDPTIGSNNLTASTYGFAAGADYHVSPDTVLGFALAGSGTNWNLAQALGTGRSDAFQAGVYGTKYIGPAYISAALAFTNNWFTTNRTALGDQLTANFQGQSFGARVEGGYRYAVAPAAGVTPYAALQAQSFHTPSYSETDLTGGGFGLTYDAMSATDTRSELGARFDALTAWGATPVQLRARLAWAHDWVSNPALSASFQALPGTSFVVNGAAVPANSALTSLGAELHLTPRWTLLGKFDGEFASSAQTYAGSGTLRYQW